MAVVTLNYNKTFAKNLWWCFTCNHALIDVAVVHTKESPQKQKKTFYHAELRNLNSKTGAEKALAHVAKTTSCSLAG